MDFIRRIWAEIDIDALKGNLSAIKRHSGGGKIMAVVKADAYGHGVQNIVPALDNAGADSFAVSNIAEAVALREIGLKKPILILGYTPYENADLLYKYDIIQCVFSAEYAKGLSLAAKKLNAKIKTFIKVDTGMGRIGFNCRDERLLELDDAILSAKLENLQTIGIFAHFADADREKDKDDGFTDDQYARFKRVLKKFDECKIKLAHSCCNSAAIMQDGDKVSGDICRPGIILYGLEPSSKLSFPELTPVMTLKSVVSFVKTISPGETISYGRTFKAEKEMKIATVSAGYADGYPRALSNKAYVLVRGQKAKVVGRVCMDQMMIDVSGTPVAAGDEVILFGKDLSLNYLADLANTINYEIICNVNKRVPRIVVKK